MSCAQLFFEQDAVIEYISMRKNGRISIAKEINPLVGLDMLHHR